MSPQHMFRDREVLPTYLKSENYFQKINGSEQGHTSIIQGVDGQKSGMFDNDGFDWVGVYTIDNYITQSDDSGYYESNYRVVKQYNLPPVNKKVSVNTQEGTRTLYNCSYDNKIKVVEIDRDYQEANPVERFSDPHISYSSGYKGYTMYH